MKLKSLICSAELEASPTPHTLQTEDQPALFTKLPHSLKEINSVSKSSESTGPTRPSLKMSQPSIQIDLEELILSQPGSRVSQPALLERERAVKMTAGSGRKSLELYEVHARHGVSLRTCVAYLLLKGAWSSRIVSLTWKPLVTNRKVLSFQLVPSTPRRIGATDSGFWPTPDATPRGPAKEFKGTRPSGAKEALTLETAVTMWPTPNSRDYKDTLNSKPNLQEHLLDRVRQQMWPTPNASDSNTANMKDDHDVKRGYLRGVVKMAAEKTEGSLAPNFVEWLMGYPEDWTKLDDTRDGKTESRKQCKR